MPGAHEEKDGEAEGNRLDLVLGLIEFSSITTIVLWFCFSPSQIFFHRNAGSASWILEQSLDSDGSGSSSAQISGFVTLDKLPKLSAHLQKKGSDYNSSVCKRVVVRVKTVCGL